LSTKNSPTKIEVLEVGEKTVKMRISDVHGQHIEYTEVGDLVAIPVHCARCCKWLGRDWKLPRTLFFVGMDKLSPSLEESWYDELYKHLINGKCPTCGRKLPRKIGVIEISKTIIYI